MPCGLSDWHLSGVVLAAVQPVDGPGDQGDCQGQVRTSGLAPNILFVIFITIKRLKIRCTVCDSRPGQARVVYGGDGRRVIDI
jgi:hypothetical protein